MVSFLERSKQHLRTIKARSKASTPEPEQRGPALILEAIEAVEQGEGIRGQWADVCLRLAEAQDYPSVELRPGWTVDGGAHLWKLFCGNANTSWLRDLAYPALKELQDSTLPDEVKRPDQRSYRT